MLRQWLPTHVRVRKRPREDVRPGWHGGEGRDHVVIKHNRRARELVQIWRPDKRVAVSPQMVPAERVRNNNHYVRTVNHRYPFLGPFFYRSCRSEYPGFASGSV